MKPTPEWVPLQNMWRSILVSENLFTQLKLMGRKINHEKLVQIDAFSWLPRGMFELKLICIQCKKPPPPEWVKVLERFYGRMRHSQALRWNDEFYGLLMELNMATRPFRVALQPSDRKKNYFYDFPIDVNWPVSIVEKKTRLLFDITLSRSLKTFYYSRNNPTRRSQ